MDAYQATPTHSLPTLNYTIESQHFGTQAPLVGQGVSTTLHHSPSIPMNTMLDDSSASHSCAICGDRATGKHYGAYSCDGCKGFFRRSVRKSQNYTCRHHRQCTIDKDKRNQCRYCRLQKCFRVGMRKEAVQNERDKISTRRNSYDDPSARHEIGINALLEAENQGQRSFQNLMEKDRSKYANGPRFAQLNHVTDSMRTQLLVIVEWAKSLTCFTKLSVDDQIALLRAHAGEFLILGVVYRSLDREDSLVLGNNFVISRSTTEPDISKVAVHIFDRLFFPLKEIRLDQIEYACLKAVLFFDPNAKDLSESQRRQVKAWRHQIQIDLMNYMNDKQYSTAGRFGDLLLMLPDLRMITQMMIQQVSLAKLTGFAQIDDLLQEMLLAEKRKNCYHYEGSYMDQANGQDAPPTDPQFQDRCEASLLYSRPPPVNVMASNMAAVSPTTSFVAQTAAMQISQNAINGQSYQHDLTMGTTDTHSILDLDVGHPARYVNHQSLASIHQSRSVPTSPTPNSFVFEPKTVPPIVNDRRFFKSETDYLMK